MNIRRTTRGSCRMCDKIAYDASWGNVFPGSYYTMTPEDRQQIGNRYNAIKLELDRRNLSNLYALEAITASGHKIEIICKTHLAEFIKEVQKEIPDICNVQDVDGQQKESVSSLEDFPLQIS